MATVKGKSVSGGAAFARADKIANDELKEELKGIRNDVSALNSSDIKARWVIGGRILRIVNDKTGKYGTNPKELVEQLMPLGRDGLRPMMRVAEVYSGSEIDRLADIKHPATGERLTWSHVAALSRMPDKDKSFAMAERAAEKGWSSKDLVAEIVRGAGGPKSAGGRKAKKHGTFLAGLSSVIATCTHLSNTHAQAWSGAGGLADLFDDGEVSEQLIKEIEKTIGAVDSARTSIDTLRSELGALKHRAAARLTPKAVV